MAHLLLVDLPGGNDFTVMEDAVAAGHQVTFVTSDLAHYRSLGAAGAAGLALATCALEVPDMALEAVLAMLEPRIAGLPVDGVLCILDIRIVLAAELAAHFGVPFMRPDVARLLRDKVRTREHLRQHGIAQPRFAMASTSTELRAAVAVTGLPALVKPADGFASQDITLLRDAEDLAVLAEVFDARGNTPVHYGLSVQASQRWAVEAYLEGALIGCDVFSTPHGRVLLGINHKVLMPPPSFAMRGGCFPAEGFDVDAIRAYVFAVLDCLQLDVGATHVEIKVTADGPLLVEVNPRLVSAQIPFQLGYAFGDSLYDALIDLHLGRPLPGWLCQPPPQVCAIRWLTTAVAGVLTEIVLPEQAPAEVRRVVVFRRPGDVVRPARNNGDRIAYVMAVGPTQQEAEATAEAYLAAIRLTVQPAP